MTDICTTENSKGDYMNFTNKKLLILGGTHQHCKMVRAAKELGVYVIVTDYLEESPAKKIADQSLMYNIKDVDAIVDFCKREHVDGILHGYIDPCQRPYGEICRRLGLPCFGEEKQYFTLTDKRTFKKLCRENGVDTIPEYPIDIFTADGQDSAVEYPVFVKPVDSRGSRGLTICNSAAEVRTALEFARKEASNGDVIIERYLGGKDEFQVTYFFIDGEAYLLRTADRHLGDAALHLEKVGICTVSPSVHTDMYLNQVHEKVVAMYKKLGIKNGPVFMQGLVDGDKIRFFDPGMRFPGGDYENLYREIFGIDIMKMLVEYALHGEFSRKSLPRDSVLIKDKRIALLFPTIAPGRIHRIEGLGDLTSRDGIISVFPKYDVGDTVAASYNVNQRFAEIDLIGKNTPDLRNLIRYIQENLKVYDAENHDLMFGKVERSKIKNYIVNADTKRKYLS